MCVIIYKPVGVAKPSYQLLKRAAKFNPHGFGFVSTNQHYKTLHFETFYQHFKSVSENDECLIHFRYATHGSVCERNCHPFVENDVFFAHNGILSIQPMNDMTDSETAFRNQIYPAIEHFGYFSKKVDDVINEIIAGSKFALMYNNQVRLFGMYNKMDGCYFSNLRFMLRE